MSGKELNTVTTDIVNQDEFNMELQNYYSKHNEKSKKLEWTAQRIQSIINLLDEYNILKSKGMRVTNKHYHHARKYDVINTGDQKVLIMKGKDIADPLLQIIPTEEYYQKILEAHISTGHGRRDKIVHVLKDKYVVPIFAVTIFINMCKICIAKKSIPKKGNSVKLFSEGEVDFNRRGQIDFVDLQSCPDQEYKFLLHYQDHLTRYCFLRPLKTKQPQEVAVEMVKIFLEVGCPLILQSYIGREFTANVLKEIACLWPACKIVNGKPRCPQSQGHTNRSNQDIKNMIRSWMTENNSTNWSIGCYFIQFQKNSSYHTKIGQTPHKAMFGEDPKLGLSSTYLSKHIISKLENEEDMEKLFEDINIKEEPISENSQEEVQQYVHVTIKQERSATPSHETMNGANNPEVIPVYHEYLPTLQNIKQEEKSLDSTSSIDSDKQTNLDENINKKIIKFEKNITPIDNKISHRASFVNIDVEECNLLQEKTESQRKLKRVADKIKSSFPKKLKDVS